MNTTQLLEQMKRLDLAESDALMLLTEARIISDHCLRVWDIAQPDLSRAVQWFTGKRWCYGTARDINEKYLA